MYDGNSSVYKCLLWESESGFLFHLWWRSCKVLHQGQFGWLFKELHLINVRRIAKQHFPQEAVSLYKPGIHQKPPKRLACFAQAFSDYWFKLKISCKGHFLASFLGNIPNCQHDGWWTGGWVLLKILGFNARVSKAAAWKAPTQSRESELFMRHAEVWCLLPPKALV